jgi:alkylation response protein AidB-like acyl-CoA dehydrogenase
MAVELRAAELLTLEAAWKLQQKTATDMDMAMAKLKATEMLASEVQRHIISRALLRPLGG